jgi:hypothetical protein
MKPCVYHRSMVPVEGLEMWTHISNVSMYRKKQMARRGPTEWLREGWARLGTCCIALNGSLLCQQQEQWKIKLLNENGALVEYWLAVVLTTIPGNSGNVDPVSTFVETTKSPVAVALQVLKVVNIVSCVHVIPWITTSSMTRDWLYEWLIVNSHIDLASWNNVDN